jgi:YVTN family beta-propeller protein
VAIHPSDDSRAYVTHSGGDTIGVIDLASNAMVASIPVDFGPWGLAFNTAGTRLYSNSFDSDSVSVIDTQSGLVIDVIAVGDGPTDVVLSATPPCPADFNGDAVIDTRDVLAFLNAWTAGCP